MKLTTHRGACVSVIWGCESRLRYMLPPWTHGWYPGLKLVIWKKEKTQLRCLVNSTPCLKLKRFLSCAKTCQNVSLSKPMVVKIFVGLYSWFFCFYQFYRFFAAIEQTGKFFINWVVSLSLSRTERSDVTKRSSWQCSSLTIHQ